MIVKALHKYWIRGNMPEKIGKNEFLSEEGEVYEVVRIIGGIPLFIEDHINRFYNSLSIEGIISGLNPGEIETHLSQLISFNQVSEGNVRFSMLKEFRAFFIAHKYPDENDYLEGIRCGMLNRERQKPEAKTMQENVRGTADRFLDESGYYEVLLVDNNNQITEGSRSNVFFIRDNCFFTPFASDVLPGTTRNRIIALIRQMKLNLLETKINLTETAEFEAAFITGTSPKVLPVREIDGYTFRTDNLLMRKIMKEYDKMVRDYLLKKL